MGERKALGREGRESEEREERGRKGERKNPNRGLI